MMRLIDLLKQRGLLVLTSKPLAAYMVRRPHHIVKFLRGKGVKVLAVSYGGFPRIRGERFSLIRKLNRRRFRKLLASLAKEGPVLWVSGVPYWWAWEGLGWAAVVYDLTDFMPGFGFDEGDVARSLRAATVSFAVSGALLRWARQFSERVYLLENGVDPKLFREAARDEKRSVAFWGALSGWVLVEHLEAAARAGLPLKLAGRAEGENLERLLKYKNVKFIGELPYAALPEFLRDVKVGLVPFDFSPQGVGYYSCPLKIFEAWAAGAAVVSTPIAVAQEKAEPGVLELAESPEGFAERVEELLRRADSERARRRAEAQSWKKLLEEAFSLPIT